MAGKANPRNPAPRASGAPQRVTIKQDERSGAYRLYIGGQYTGQWAEHRVGAEVRKRELEAGLRGRARGAALENPFSAQLRAAMQDLGWAQQAHNKKPTAATKAKLEKAKARFEALAAKSNPGNPDFFRDRWGRPHPIRGTPEYEEGFVGMSRADKRYLRSAAEQPRGGYTGAPAGRDKRIERAKAERAKPRKMGMRLASSAQEHQFTPRKAARSGRGASFY